MKEPQWRRGGAAASELGSGKAKQWCIPWGYELNNITYNRNVFDKVGVKRRHALRRRCRDGTPPP